MKYPDNRPMKKNKNVKRVYETRAVRAINSTKLAEKILKKLNAHDSDKGNLHSITALLNDYYLFGQREFPITDYKKTLAEYLKLKKRELTLLQQNNCRLADKLFIDTSHLQMSIAKIQSEISVLKKTPALKGRRPEYFLNQILSGLLKIWFHKKHNLKISKELTDWIKFALTQVSEIHSEEALAKKISRIIKNNSDLKKMTKSQLSPSK